jgi:hypothetical protein
METKEYVSLFDYLGKPAGPVLGKKVATIAKKIHTPMSSRKVKTEKFKGSVVLYKRSFLDFYFKKN